MKSKTILIKMTDAYEYQSFYNSIDDVYIIDCRDIKGTKCYLDDVAKEELLNRLSPYSCQSIHFIDSGNYHYISLLWISKIDVDFNLILFDHHPDNQPPGFGMITSCGGWVLEATETLPHLKNVYTFGVGEMPDCESISADLPIYISIDKDVLATDYAITDWDQGNMDLNEMLDIISNLFENHRLLGVDICGDSGNAASSGAVINNQTNQAIFDFFSKNI